MPVRTKASILLEVRSKINANFLEQNSHNSLYQLAYRRGNGTRGMGAVSILLPW